MKLIKISPKFQITIPSYLRASCSTGWFSLTEESGVITLRPVEIREKKTEEDVFTELTGDMKMPWDKYWRREGDSNHRDFCKPTRFPSVRTRPLCDLSYFISKLGFYIMKPKAFEGKRALV